MNPRHLSILLALHSLELGALRQARGDIEHGR